MRCLLQSVRRVDPKLCSYSLVLSIRRPRLVFVSSWKLVPQIGAPIILDPVGEGRPSLWDLRMNSNTQNIGFCTILILTVESWKKTIKTIPLYPYSNVLLPNLPSWGPSYGPYRQSSCAKHQYETQKNNFRRRWFKTNHVRNLYSALTLYKIYSFV